MINRLKVKGTGARKPSDPTNEPNFYLCPNNNTPNSDNRTPMNQLHCSLTIPSQSSYSLPAAAASATASSDIYPASTNLHPLFPQNSLLSMTSMSLTPSILTTLTKRWNGLGASGIMNPSMPSSVLPSATVYPSSLGDLFQFPLSRCLPTVVDAGQIIIPSSVGQEYERMMDDSMLTNSSLEPIYLGEPHPVHSEDFEIAFDTVRSMLAQLNGDEA